jgi:hypothetical protein
MINVLQYSEKHKRDDAFNRLRNSDEPNERQVVRWSDPVPMMISEQEFKLDEKGRVIYDTKYFLAYPQESTWKRLKEKH